MDGHTVADNICDKNKQMHQLKWVALIYAISLLFWGTIVWIRERRRRDVAVLRRRYLTFECNGWCMLHFAAYTAAGALAPDYWWLLIACGVAFEYVEDHLSSYSRYIDSNVIGDTLVNTGGVVFGMFLRHVVERALG